MSAILNITNILAKPDKKSEDEQDSDSADEKQFIQSMTSTNNFNLFKRRKQVYCGNCGKIGHIYKRCIEPIISLGIIDFKIDSIEKDKTLPPQNLSESYLDIDKNKIFNSPTLFLSHMLKIKNKMRAVSIDDSYIPYKNHIDLHLFCSYQNSIKFLMIRRKNTLGFIEFVRGRYDEKDADCIISLFEQMTADEIKKIDTSNFDGLWNDLWTSNKYNKNYEQEYEMSKKKFEILKQPNQEHDLSFYTKNVRPKWHTPEWGFPKGRRNFHERDLECAKREFSEETGLNNEDYVILKNITPLEEELTGTDNVRYKHIYFVSMSTATKDAKIDPNNKTQMDEIGDIGWFTFDEAIRVIRPYHTGRKKLLTHLYLYIMNKLIQYYRICHRKQLNIT